ncbi:MAG: hypothetical protein IPP93_05670 [Chitinophagaceae bacterium]|nr:hypothetical protein [Chitinophagaceae bacterium]
MKKILFCSLAVCIAHFTTFSQNVGINATGASPDASAMLDISNANKGLLVPRVALTATNATGPVTSPASSLMVYNIATAGAGVTAVSPGYYYWDGTQWVQFLTSGTAWKLGGNNLVANSSFGTLSSHSVDFVTNGLVRGRMSNLGEFFWGATNTTISGDLMNGVSNATFPFAVNGYSSFNGSGVYGAITAGTTSFAGVQGEYNSTAASTYNTCGVRGVNYSTAAGTGFRTQVSTGPRVGVIGNTGATSGQYTFGVHGTMGSTDMRCGGLFGDDFGIAMGAIGYYAANLVDYSVYGFGGAYQVGVPGGRGIPQGNDEPNTQIGLGIYGGVMGGWMRGMVYGTMVKGERFGMYVDGKTYTNAPVTELINTGSANRTPAYAVTSLTTEMYSKGKGTLSNGVVHIDFDPAFSKLISTNPDDLVITVTPTSASSGLFIEKQDAGGFTIRENSNSSNTVNFNWIAMATRADAATVTHSPEILRSDFDQRMNGVMFNDNNTRDKPQSIWWDGKEIRFDTPPAKKTDPEMRTNSRMETQTKL